MTKPPPTTSRRFPDYSWAWPTGALDQLLKAALVPDKATALVMAKSWLDHNDIDRRASGITGCSLSFPNVFARQFPGTLPTRGWSGCAGSSGHDRGQRREMPSRRCVHAANADRTGSLPRLGVFPQAKPRTDMSQLLNAARWVAKKKRMGRERRLRAVGDIPPSFRGRPVRHGRRGPLPTGEFAGSNVLNFDSEISPATKSDVSVLVEVEAPQWPRRVELEINGSTYHVARLRFRSLRRRKRALVLRFEGEAAFDAADQPFVIESRPIRQIRAWEGQQSVARFGPLQFGLLDVVVGGRS